MAKIEFPKGAGAVGRTVFQKLRELKHLHEVSWDDSLLFKTPLEYSQDEKRWAAKRKPEDEPLKIVRTKAQRGKALNRQKANSVADLAAVLAGEGRGNKIVTPAEGDKGQQKLMDITVSWADIKDMGYAESWSDNVTHTDLVEEPVTETELPAGAEAAA